jgi:hypothetical protein
MHRTLDEAKCAERLLHAAERAAHRTPDAHLSEAHRHRPRSIDDAAAESPRSARSQAKSGGTRPRTTTGLGQ